MTVPDSPGPRPSRSPLHFWRADTRADVDDEILFHIEQRIHDLMLRGTPADAARAQAEREFGNRTLIRQQMLTIDTARARRANYRELLSDLRDDLRVTWRGLRRSPSFTITAVACVALGVCVTTTVFGAVNAILLRPLPFREPGQLVSIYGQLKERNINGSNISWPDYMSWRDENRSFAGVGIWTWSSMAFSGHGDPQRVETAEVSANVFPLLGVHPALGRQFAPEEERPGNDRVILLSDNLWHRRYGGDSSIVGRTIMVDARPYEVIGVMPPHFGFPEHGEAWTPFAVDPAQEEHGNRGYAGAIARLRPGVSVDAAQADLDVISAKLAKDFPQDNRGWTAQIVDLRTDVAGDFRRPLLVFLAAVGFVLLIASANVANLLLARAASRQQETAVRMALGAGRARIVRAVMTESVLISALGGAIGLMLARAGLPLLSRAFPNGTPYFFQLEMDVRVMLFTVLVTALSAMLFGVLPALSATQFDLQSRLRDASRATGGRTQGRARRGLVIGEVALSVVLLVGALLLVRSYQALLATDLGFDTRNTFTARFTLPESRYPTNAARRQFSEQLYQRLKALPGVASVGAAQGIPFSGWNIQGEMSVEGKPGRRPGDELVVHYQSVSADYFPTIGTPLLRGRMLSDRDRDTVAQVAVINETLAKLEFPGVDPIGRRIKSGSIDENHPWVTIVGVVKDIRHYRLPQKMGPALYYPQAAWPTSTQALVIRTTTPDPLDITASVRAVIKSLDPDLPLYRVQTLQHAVDASLWQQHAQGVILLAFAALALLLAAVGLYGVVAWSVPQRTREVGIRMALGSTGGRAAALILGDSMKLTAFGILIGIVAALALSQLLASLLYRVSPFDAVAFSVVPLVLASVAGLASWIPARRAARIDPVRAMRAE